MREIIFIMQSVCICMFANEAEASMCMFSPLCQSVCVCEYLVMTQLLTLIFRLTGVNEELVRDSGMVHVMNCTGKDGSEDLKVCEHSLERRRSVEGRAEGTDARVSSLDKNTLSSLEPLIGRGEGV